MSTETVNWVPSSCTLPTVERPLREREFARLFASELRGVTRTSPTNAEFALTARSLDTARDLAARETSCCSFFTFDLRELDAGAVMSITVPPAHAAVLEALVDSALRISGSGTAGA
ncbi:hypothetical protein [Agromyces bauzanensis]